MKEQSVAKGVGILAFAGIVVKILSLLYIPFLLAIIGEEGNGIYAAAYQVYVLVYVISNAGIPVAISKLVSELIAVGNIKDAIRSFKIARFLLLVVGIIMSVLMFITADPLSKLLNFEKSYLAVLALSPTLLFTSVASAYRGYFQGMGNMKPTAISQIIEQVINTVFTLVFAALLLRYGVEAACAGGTVGTSLGALFTAVFLVYYQKKYVRNSGKPRNKPGVERYAYFDLVKRVINYSVPITLCIGLQYAGNLIDLGNTKTRLLTAGFTESYATQLYSHLYKYQQLLNAPIAITVALAAAILPAISAAVALRDRGKIENRVNYAFRLCFLVTIPSAVGFSVLSGPIFELLKYGPGAELMRYGSIALVMLAVVQVQTSILQGAGKLYTVTVNLIFGILGKIITNYFLIAIYEVNIMGAVIGSIVGYCISITLNMIVIQRSLKVKLSLVRMIVRPVFSSAVMGAAVFLIYKFISLSAFLIGSSYIINAIAAITAMSSGAAVYFTLMVLLGGITEEEFDLFPRKLLKFIPEGLKKRAKLNKKAAI